MQLKKTIEKEYKWLLKKEEFAEVLEQYRRENGKEQVVEQINHYYDSQSDTLAKRGITLRVREKNETYSMQFKQVEQISNGCQISQEKKQSISTLPEYIQASKIGWKEDETFFPLGNMLTKRHRFHLSETSQLDLDENMYLGCTDYEVELEFNGVAPAQTIAKFQLYKANHSSKFQRFMSELRK